VYGTLSGVLTHEEATERATLIDTITCDVTLDLTVSPPRSRTVLRFRCRRPGATTFADLSAGTATLNDARIDPPEDGRLMLRGLQAENVVIADTEVPDRALARDDDYLLISSFPSTAPDVFACFDQPGFDATATLTVTAPADWTCISNGPVAEQTGGTWRFAPVAAAKAFDFTLCAGRFAGNGQGLWYRRELAGSTADLNAFDEMAREAFRYYEQRLGVARPYPKYDIVFHRELRALALSVPGLMVVNEIVLDRMADPEDDFATELARHEVAHQWFGCLVGMRWWDDLWLDEAMANFVSYPTPHDWIEFVYRAEENGYHADEMPGCPPVSSPVETMAQALDRPSQITYVKGASVIRQLAALIGEDAVYRGLNECLTRFTGSVAIEDLIGCWSRASGRDLTGWADEWLRTSGHSTLRFEGGAIIQDNPRTHRIGVGLYDLDGTRLRHRRTIQAEITGPRTEIPEARADAVILNDGNQTFARIRFDDRTFASLRTAAMNTGNPLTEAVCWTAAWHAMTSAELPARDLVDLITRRLAADPPLPRPAVEVLVKRAVAAADLWAPPAERAVLREPLATALFDTERRTAGPSIRRLLATGFADSAESSQQLTAVRDLLARTAEAPTRWRLLAALSAKGLVTDEEIETMAARDPAAGQNWAATCQARRPDRAAKEASWSAVLDAVADGRWWIARAHADGIWVPGQEDLMTSFRDRYFEETLPRLISLGGQDPERAQLTRRLATTLFPITLAEETTVAAVREALRGQVPAPMRDLLIEREVTVRAMIAARR
jgi:aminopeptidase N